MLQRLNDRIDTLEKNRGQPKYEAPTQKYWPEGRKFNRGQGRGFGLSQSRGRARGEYRPQRRISNYTFQPTCYSCKQKGHVQRNCPLVQNRIICYNCDKQEHLQRNCPDILRQITCLNCKEKGHRMKDCPNV